MAMRFKNIPITAEIFNALKGTVNAACCHYILGRACIWEKGRRTGSGESHIIFGSDYGYSATSAGKFIAYANAIDKLHRLSQDLVRDIFEEKVRLSMDNVITIARNEPEEIFRIVERISDKSVKVIEIFPSRSGRMGNGCRSQSAPGEIIPRATIKDTPAYDPDAKASGLFYTIPSWVSAIERVFMDSGLGSITSIARHRLRRELLVLVDTAEAVLGMLEEAP